MEMVTKTFANVCMLGGAKFKNQTKIIFVDDT